MPIGLRVIQSRTIHSTCRKHGLRIDRHLPVLQYGPRLEQGAGYKYQFARPASTKATVKLDSLPQGLLKSERNASRPRNEEPTYPTVVQQARDNMRKFENCVVLTRVGGFYEVIQSQRSTRPHAD